MRKYEDKIPSLISRLRESYGDILTLDEIRDVFRYKTLAAVRKAHSRKTLAVPLYKFRGRSGFFARVEDVAESIEKMNLA